jgi:signal transduction histidine kinase
LGPLTRSKEQGIQAAAKLRFARNLSKANRIEEALKTYTELSAQSTYSSFTFTGLPIDLIARSARCGLLVDQDDYEQLRIEAKSLFDDLQNRRWRLDRSSYLYYLEQTKEWLNDELHSDLVASAMAEAVSWLWENKRGENNSRPGEPERDTRRFHEQAITLLWLKTNDGITAAIVGARYQQNHWFNPIFSNPEYSSVAVMLYDDENRLLYGENPEYDIPFSSRSGLISGLPWNVSLYNTNLDLEMSQFAQRRRLMFTGVGILILLVVAVSFLISRAVTRELAAARLQADFVSAVSHEFRTPLTSMRQFTEMLLEDESLPDDKRRTFHMAQARATNRLSRLVESLLDFGRMEAGARPYRLEPIDVSELSEIIVEEYRKEASLEASRIIYMSPNQTLLISADREAFSQALWNLIDNAVKYSEEDTEVKVVGGVGKNVEIKVMDQGFGIPSTEISTIMSKFVRGSSAKKHGIKGTGIGLAMVKHIIEAHGGNLKIESEVGKGSTFTIVLPSGGNNHA